MLHRPGRGRIPLRRVPLTNGPEQPPQFSHTFERTTQDCAQVKRTLSKACNFPPEIIDIVMDFAEYWVCSVTSIDFSVTATGHLTIRGSEPKRENKLILRTGPLGLPSWHADDHDRWQSAAATCPMEEEYPQEELKAFVEGSSSTLVHPARKVVFDIVSRDQGHGGSYEDHGSFRHSWTWFDAGIDRFDKGHKRPEDEERAASDNSSGDLSMLTTGAIRSVWPPLKEDASEYDHQLHTTSDHKIQCNRLAEHDWQNYHVEWSWTDNIDPESSAGNELEVNGRGSATGDGNFIKRLRIGDMVTVWGRARFPGWSNNIQKVQVQVYTAL
ncbi:hypothetical protein F4808DRAFT_423879 [Astrocystis sublimbata]|nr:hypothetical protein F4808DRAFT_423879 [Astrocystis sublimbata]